MAVKKLAAAGGQWNTAATWEPSGVPEAKDELEITKASNGSTLTLKTTIGKCRSIVAEAGCTLKVKQETALEIGDATAPSGSKALVLQSGMTWTDTSGAVKFISTSASVLSVTTGGVAMPEFKFTSGKYQLEDDFTTAGPLEGQINELNGGNLNLNGHTLTCGAIWTDAAGSVLSFGSGKVVLQATNNNWKVSAGTINAETGTIELLKGGLFAGGGQTYNKVIFAGTSTELRGSNTFATLEATAAKAVVKFEKGTTQTLKKLVIEGSKAGSLAKLESTEAGKEWKVIFTEAVTVKNVVVKDSHATATEASKFEPTDEYEGLTEAEVNISGNEHWKFVETVTTVKGKASGTILLTGSATGTAANRVQGKASGPLLLTGTAKGLAANVVGGKATGTLTLTGTSKATLAARILGHASGALLLTGTATGRVAQVVAGKATGTILFTGTAKGSVSTSVTGKAFGTLLFTGSARSTFGGKALGLPGLTAPVPGRLVP